MLPMRSELFGQLAGGRHDERVGDLEHELPSRRLALGPVDHLVAPFAKAEPSAVRGQDFLESRETGDQSLAQKILEGRLGISIRIGGFGSRFIQIGLGTHDDRPRLGDQVGRFTEFLRE